MLFHVLGLGSIGSLVSVHLARCTAGNNVRLIMRNRDFARSTAVQQAKGGDDSSRRRTDKTAPTLIPSSLVKHLLIEQEGDPVFPVTSFDVELLPFERNLRYSHPHSSHEVHERAKERDRSLQSVGMIESLFITTKAPQVLPALQSLLPRLSKDSTIVLLQNGSGLVESLVSNLFTDEASRPNFVVGVNSHGAYIKGGATTARRPPQRIRAGSGGAQDGTRSSFFDESQQPPQDGPTPMTTVWAGVGSIPFCVIPNIHVRQAITDSSYVSTLDPASNPLLNALSRTPPDLSNLPITPRTQALHTTVSALVSCAPLNTSWLPVSELLAIQLQKVAVNAIINPLTAIFDVQNGTIRNEHGQRVAYRVAKEASDVFAAQLKRNIELQQRLSSGSNGSPGSAEGQDEGPTTGSSHGGAKQSRRSAGTVQAMAELSTEGTFYPGHPLHPDMLLEKAMEIAGVTSSNVSSMLQDVRAGRLETEVDFINGYISQLGSKFGVSTPLNDSLADLVKYKVWLGIKASREALDASTSRLDRRRMQSEYYGEVYMQEREKVRPRRASQ